MYATLVYLHRRRRTQIPQQNQKNKAAMSRIIMQEITREVEDPERNSSCLVSYWLHHLQPPPHQQSPAIASTHSTVLIQPCPMSVISTIPKARSSITGTYAPRKGERGFTRSNPSVSCRSSETSVTEYSYVTSDHGKPSSS